MRTTIAMLAGLIVLSACGGSSSDDPGPAVGSSQEAPLSDGGLAELAASFGDAPFMPDGDPPALPNLFPTVNDSGFAMTFSTAGVIDRTGPFFQSLGVNGRSCSSCHIQAEGWSITPRGVQARFEKTEGTDAIFRRNDGSNSPLAAVSTIEARRSAYSMLLTKGLIRIGIGIPAGAEFELAAVDDPYGFASAKELSLFRRPLPTANIEFLSTVMWDGRETNKDPTSTDCTFGTTDCFASVHFNLDQQANGATEAHAEAITPLTPAQRKAIVEFQTGLFTAQVFDWRAGRLNVHGARGGPVGLASETIYFGINDTLVGDYRTRAPFTPVAMTLFDGWTSYEADPASPDDERRHQGAAAARRAIARGQTLFNSKPIQIRDVKGLNDDLGIATIPGTCTTCHNAPNVGHHTVPLPLDIGLADASRRTPDMPLYTLRHTVTGETVQTTDPGRALITGKWKDIGRFKGPVLRGLAGRAPYFHNGMAKDLNEAVEFYDTRFGMSLTLEEKADLVALLRTL